MKRAGRWLSLFLLSVLGIVLFAVVLGVVLGTAVYLHPLWVADQQVRARLWWHGVHSEYVDVGGYRVHYFEGLPAKGAPGDGRMLILIHGLGSRGEDWAPLIPRLAAAGFHVYAPDLLGYGRSPRPDVDYSITLEEKLVVEFMRTLHLPRADVGGWSMGGWVGAKLTLDHPELVDRLILYDSAGIYFPATFDAALFTPTDQAGLAHLTAMLEPEPKPLPAFVTRAALKKLAANRWIVERSVYAMLNGHDLLDFRLSGLTRPTLLVWGSKDVLIPLSVGETMHGLIPQSSLEVIEGCGHLAPAECPNSAAKATLEFLEPEQAPKSIERKLPGE